MSIQHRLTGQEGAQEIKALAEKIGAHGLGACPEYHTEDMLLFVQRTERAWKQTPSGETEVTWLQSRLIAGLSAVAGKRPEWPNARFYFGHEGESLGTSQPFSIKGAVLHGCLNINLAITSLMCGAPGAEIFAAKAAAAAMDQFNQVNQEAFARWYATAMVVIATNLHSRGREVGQEDYSRKAHAALSSSGGSEELLKYAEWLATGQGGRVVKWPSLPFMRQAFFSTKDLYHFNHTS